MDVARAAGINAGHDAAQSITAFRIGELMAAQAETGIVVAAFVVGLPEIQQGAGERFAGASEHEANQLDRLPCHALFEQLGSLRRRRLEVWPFDLRQGYFVAVVACRRGSKRGLSQAAIDREH